MTVYPGIPNDYRSSCARRRRTALPLAMAPRKRTAAEMEAEAPPQEPTMLHRLRNMWQFANLAQYLALFIDALRIDTDFDVEVCTSTAWPLFRCLVLFDYRPMLTA